VAIPNELAEAARFHTHLGPFLVVGLRIGRVVVRELGDDRFAIRIRAHTGKVPPYSCMVDGIQLSTGCTVGNGCLEMTDRREMAVEATRGTRSLVVGLRRDMLTRIETECTRENEETFACEIWEMPEDRLLSVTARSREEPDD
jgi:formylmethanofuran dehydrogenase subunit E